MGKPEQTGLGASDACMGRQLKIALTKHQPPPGEEESVLHFPETARVVERFLNILDSWFRVGQVLEEIGKPKP